jgi:hypothetical protein
MAGKERTRRLWGKRNGIGHAHLKGPSGFITGGVKGNFQFLPRLWTGPEEGDRRTTHTDLSILSGSGEDEATWVRTNSGVLHTSPN